MNIKALSDTKIQNIVILNFAKETFTQFQIVLFLQGLHLALNEFQDLSVHHFIFFLSLLIAYLLYIKEVRKA